MVGLDILGYRTLSVGWRTAMGRSTLPSASNTNGTGLEDLGKTDRQTDRFIGAREEEEGPYKDPLPLPAAAAAAAAVAATVGSRLTGLPVSWV